MKLSEDEITEKYPRQCKYCLRKTSLPYEYEWSSISCKFNSIKKNTNLLKYNEKKTFNTRKKYAENKLLYFYRSI